MVEWIHVITANKLPTPRSGGSPFEQYEDGFDPNVDTPFGPDKESMFLLVVQGNQPAFNEVTEKLESLKTVGADDISYFGTLSGSTWIKGWVVVPQTLEGAREIKIQRLVEDREAHIIEGYRVGPFTFPLIEYFFDLLESRLRWLELAIQTLTVEADYELTFSDLKDKRVSVTVGQLTNHFVLFGLAFLGTYEKEVDARDEIKAASTPAEVDAVTWSF